MQFGAFFSYSRQDERLAQWLWKKLDTFRTPKDLIDTNGAYGKVPKTLNKIFRDRSDLGSGGQVSEGLDQALRASDNLIVLCTPAAAKSEWVNHEIQTFIELGRSDRIFPVIGSGAPNSNNPETECFPPVLRDAGILAADLREIKESDGRIIGDGKETGRLKLIAGLLGVSLDTLIQREVKRQRRTIRSLALASIVFLTISVIAIVAGIVAFNNQQRAERRLDLAAKASIENVLALSTVRAAIENESFADSRRDAKVVGGTSYRRLLDEYSETAEIKDSNTTDQIELWKAEALIDMTMQPGWLNAFGMKEEWLSDAGSILDELSDSKELKSKLPGVRQKLAEAIQSAAIPNEIDQPFFSNFRPSLAKVLSCISVEKPSDSGQYQLGDRFEIAVLGEDGSSIYAFDVTNDQYSGFNLGEIRQGRLEVELNASPPLGTGQLYLFSTEAGPDVVSGPDAMSLLASLLLSSHLQSCPPTVLNYEILE